MRKSTLDFTEPVRTEFYDSTLDMSTYPSLYPSISETGDSLREVDEGGLVEEVPLTYTKKRILSYVTDNFIDSHFPKKKEMEEKKFSLTPLS